MLRTLLQIDSKLQANLSTYLLAIRSQFEIYSDYQILLHFCGQFADNVCNIKATLIFCVNLLPTLVIGKFTYIL